MPSCEEDGFFGGMHFCVEREFCWKKCIEEEVFFLLGGGIL